jgi:uncharacterized repeat protein (TIGR03803 family)
MNLSYSLLFSLLRRCFMSVVVLKAFTMAHGTPVFEPVQAFVRSPEIPQAKLIQASDGTFYGTTGNGGSSGLGTVFKMTAAGTMTTLVNFTSTNGASPRAELIQGSDGNYYGTTNTGGSGNRGTVFRMTPSGTLTTLVHFSGTNGGEPAAGLLQGSDGNYYGTTQFGGASGYGIVFKMTPGGSLTTLVTFSSTAGYPVSRLIQGSDGNYYGTTSGGAGAAYGSVFKMTPSGALTTLVTFTGTNGLGPGSLVKGNDGNFYGTTNQGGVSNLGTAFKVTPSGTLTTLVSFTITTGTNNKSDLLLGSDGNFYGSTQGGGTGDNGTVFRMTPGGALTTLVNFNYSNGAAPLGGLIQGGDGDFYGTTTNGGSAGRGTVFKMTAGGSLTTLAGFFSANGTDPYAEATQGSDGNFFGTTRRGGASYYGTVFSMSPSGTLTTLANFNGVNGRNSMGTLMQGSDGNFYGTTHLGGSNDSGTVIRITPAGALTAIANFTTANGSSPYGRLIQSSDGNYYGTTYSGGASGYGTVFKMTPTGTLTTLVSFTSINGAYPYAGLTQGSDGNFYGTTVGGGGSGNGTVFKMTPSGILTTLASFTGSNGKEPQAALIQGDDGNFYGTTRVGGAGNYGTVFKMTQGGTVATLVNFTSANGAYPETRLLQSSDGGFYGTTYSGGSGNNGTVFRMNSDGTLTTLANFNGPNGASPRAGLTRAANGHLYGTTSDGGTRSDGQPAGGGQIYRLRMGPTLISQPQTNVASTSVTLNGTVNPGGYSTSVSFQYGTDPTLAIFSSASAGTLPVGTTETAVQASVSGLQPGTTYYYRLLASNVENTVPQFGPIINFITLAPDIALDAPTGTPVTNGSGTLAFTSTGTGQTRDLAVTVRNTGGSDLNFIAASITSAQAGQFSLVSTPSATLAAGASAAFTVRFSPTSPGAKVATLSLASNDPDENPFTVALTGTGADTSPPVVVSWSFEHDPVEAGGFTGSQSMQLRITDESGFSSGSVGLFPPGTFMSGPPPAPQITTANRISGTAQDGVYQVYVSIPRDEASVGTWHLAGFSVTDTAGNSGFRSTDGGGGPLTFQMNGDYTGPVLESVSITPSVVTVQDASADVSIELHITDALLGFGMGYIQFQENYSGPTHYVSIGSSDRISGTAQDGIYRVILTIPRYSMVGMWNLGSVNLSDTAPNSRSYGSGLGFGLIPFPPGTPSGVTILDPPDIDVTGSTGTTVGQGSGTVAFGQIPVMQTAYSFISVRNNSRSQGLTVFLPSLSGPDASQFSLETFGIFPPTTLINGQSMNFSVHFNPTSPGLKTAILLIQSNDMDENPFTLTLTGTTFTPAEQWKNQFFGENANPADTADDADPDHDGVVNLLERAFNLSPLQPGAFNVTSGSGTTGLPLVGTTQGPDGPLITIQYLRRKASANSGLTYTPQFSSSLDGSGGWSAATGTETVQSIDAEWERVTITDSISNPPASRFGRVKVMASQ